ncbi:MAG: outer membrane protein assembly factor BamC [Burkholderiales bacterium]
MRWIYLVLAAALMSGCSSLSLEGPGVDYKSAGRAVPLEVPPDLTQLPRDDRFNAPVTAAAVARTGAGTSTSAPILPQPSSGARLERSGTQRWIVTDQTPEQVWPQIKDFWTQLGFTLRIENRDAGIMETDWAEDRAKLPKDFIARTIGAIAGQLFDTGDRDLFRTRIERVGNGTEIYISHRGATEVLNSTSDDTVWQPRPNDPNLEAEFLQRMLMRLGVEENRARATVTASAAIPAAPRARVVGAGASAYLELDDSLDRAWRRVGLALDRTGFTVEERDRNSGSYVVRYVVPRKPDKEKPGFFSRLLGRSDDGGAPERYRISLKGEGDKTRVVVVSRDNPTNTRAPSSDNILKLLADELK